MSKPQTKTTPSGADSKASEAKALWPAVTRPDPDRRGRGTGAKGEEEVLLQENKGRFVLFPIRYDAIWKMYKQSMASFWTTGEVDLGDDMKDWVTLSDGERHFIKNVLAFF